MQTETYWGMTLNPFTKELDVKDIFESEDMRQMSQRLEHLRNYPGIGLFTAPSGYGKSLALRKFTARLNPNLYKVVYTPFTSISESWEITVYTITLLLAFEVTLSPTAILSILSD
jgi:type II secretory ATPase GspE/PulE/Tfp pilus assembly ATPase PilB-like protein